MSIEYNEPNPDYNVKKIIKSIDTIERERYNREPIITIHHIYFSKFL